MLVFGGVDHTDPAWTVLFFQINGEGKTRKTRNSNPQLHPPTQYSVGARLQRLYVVLVHVGVAQVVHLGKKTGMEGFSGQIWF